MERNQLDRQLAVMRQSLLDQGYLDEKFINLEQLLDDSRPHFVEKMAALFCRDSTRVAGIIEKAPCLRTFQQLKEEYTTLKQMLQAYFQLLRQVGPKEIACRPL